MEEKKFKTLHLTVFVTGIGDTSIQVPAELDLDDAIRYAKEHIDEVRVPSNLDYSGGGMVLYLDNCDFEDN